MKFLKNSTLIVSRTLISSRGLVRQEQNYCHLFLRNYSVSLTGGGSIVIPKRENTNLHHLFTVSISRNKQSLIDRSFHLSSSINMAPPGDQRPDTPAAKIDSLIKENPVLIFSKTYCPFCNKVKALLTDLGITFHAFELDTIDPDEAASMQSALKEKTGQSTVPNVFIREKHIGGCDDTFKTHQRVGLLSLLTPQEGMETEEGANSFDYDLIVIGGGSGGLAASKVIKLLFCCNL